MLDRIEETIKELQEKRQLNVLYVCESGSRAWGFHSPDSDWDVRVLFSYSRENYLSVQAAKDNINMPVVDDLDVAGWELRKLLRLLWKSNASVFEWLQSPTVYFEKEGFREELWTLAQQYFNAKPMIHHYLGIAKNMLSKELVDEQVKIKKYFYILRPVCNALWMMKYNTPAPTVFQEALKAVDDKAVLSAIVDLLEQKKTAAEAYVIPVVPVLQDFIFKTIAETETYAKSLKSDFKDSEALDLFFRKVIG